MEAFLRKHGYQITREQFEHVIPITHSFQATRETFHTSVAFYIHEAVEIEEISKIIGRFPSAWEHAPLVAEYPETHLKAHEMYKLYLQEKGVELPPAFRGSRVQFPAGPLYLDPNRNPTLELKSRFGSDLRSMIAEAEGQKREVGVMLCQTPTRDLHLSRACWGRRETVTVADCHDGLSPLGSFHVHLGGTDVFSVPDLELAIKKEQLSCLGYSKGGHHYLKCVIPKRYYELPYETKTSIKRSLDQARQDIDRVNQLYRASPSNPEAIALSQRAQVILHNVEQLLNAYEVEL